MNSLIALLAAKSINPRAISNSHSSGHFYLAGASA